MEDKIRDFVKKLNPSALNIPKIEGIEIKALGEGAYNASFLVRVSGKEFLFKVNLRSQIKMKNQLRKEHIILKFLSGKGIAPEPVLFDDSKKILKNDVLVYEFLKGDMMRFTDRSVEGAAELFAKLHSIEVKKENFKGLSTPYLSEDLDSTMAFLEEYKKLESSNRDYIKILEECAQKIKIIIKDKASLMKDCKLCLLHADPVPSNFIINNSQVRLIDWEMANIGDGCYDVWAFLSDGYALWDLDYTLTETQKRLFLDTYLKFRKDDTLKKRLKFKSHLYSLQMITYCLYKYALFVDKKLSEAELRNKTTFEKYKRVAGVAIEELRNSLCS